MRFVYGLQVKLGCHALVCIDARNDGIAVRFDEVERIEPWKSVIFDGGRRSDVSILISGYLDEDGGIRHDLFHPFRVTLLSGGDRQK